ncbi:predicted protein [Phaeodactylum tricornutum CCAP 1055/1]|jgi:hypothetical protein|uniref:Uncharacterized protein n=2 Tax=Phaeodactylum tricornutum TaxID=2850 RepID=B7G842_PHATC|nr:predicted protein [Phaeodactylum tricornutum CCAP 1055/1]EEC44972.1 predicted protein [Phaeodactylum tricornutum CCAP 1055/1]|eukprot:XP_002183272.1 predicted protein [Phaeodactylum tricornutum CCAP 1055/1]
MIFSLLSGADTSIFLGSIVFLLVFVIGAENGVSSAIFALHTLIFVPSLISLIWRWRTCRYDVLFGDWAEDVGSRSTKQPLNPSSLSLENQQVLLNRVETALSTSPMTNVLVMAPSIALFYILLVRLFVGQDIFAGDPSQLDYGWKFGIVNGEDNIAFVPEFNSYGHWIQGVLSAAFAFPSLNATVCQFLMCRAFRKASFYGPTSSGLFRTVHFASWVLTIYPAYNLVKRFYRYSEAFAGSSFGNNGLEWAYGFMNGIAVGQMVTSIHRHTLFVWIRTDGQTFEALSRERDSWVVRGGGCTAFSGGFCVCLGILEAMLGLLLVFSVLSAAALFGLTWHGCLGGGNDCLNYEADVDTRTLLFGFCIIPTVIICYAALQECWRLKNGQHI